MSDLDEGRLADWLKRALPALSPFQSLERFQGGQSNPTYRLILTDRDYVLRRKPFGHLLPSAHAVEREYLVLGALHQAGFPAPRPIIFCEDESIIGAVFYIMEMVKGRLFWDGALPGVPKQDRRKYYETMVDALASLHALDHEALGLGEFGAPGNYFARQVSRWTKQYRSSQTDDLQEVELLIKFLPRAAPEQTRTCIIHGDYRIDNVIYDAESSDLRAVLDWELATIGDPLADFTYLAMNWILPEDGRAALCGIDFTRENLPTLEQITARYCERTGRDNLPDLHWYFAYNLFRLVGILQGVKKRFADGNASSEHAAAMAQKIVPLAKVAWDEAQRAGARA